jgi:Ca2+:H+ antiporter
MMVNILWPFVPVAIILHFVVDAPLWTFATAYIGMVPAANLLGFAGQEFARKMPKVAGILIETTFGSIVEIILFIVLIANHDGSDGSSEEGNLIPVIQAAILGSILTNLLLCLGLCFFFGGIRHASQKFHAIVSEVGSGLLLVAAFGLLIPSAFYSALKSEAAPDLLGALHDKFTRGKLQTDVLQISRAASIALMFAFALYIWYCASSQHSIFDEVIEMDEHRDADREEDSQKPKFTMTEALAALAVSLVCVTLLLVFLVAEIEHVVKSGVPDQFLGLILLPLVEKAAEHLTAIDEARGKQAPAHLILLPTASIADLVYLRWHDQRCIVSLPWSFDSDCPLQCPAGRNGRLGHGKAPGFKFRDLHDLSPRSVDSRGRKLPPRRRIELARRRTPRGTHL